MVSLKPFAAWSFAPGASNWQNQLSQITNPQRLSDDRSQYVRYARAASLMADLKRDQTILHDSIAKLHQVTSQGHAWQIALAPVDQIQWSETILPRHFQDTLRLVESTNTWFAAQTVIRNPNAQNSANGLPFIAIGNHQMIAAATEFSEGARNPARKWLPVAIMESNVSAFPCRRRCISVQRITYKDVRLRLAEQFSIQPLPISRPMDTPKTNFKFLLSDPDGSMSEACAKEEQFFTAEVIDDQVRPDMITLLEKGVIQGLLGQPATEFTTGANDSSLDVAATQLILESMSFGDFVTAIEDGRVMPAESLDFAPIVPTGALMWSLQDFDA